MKNVIKIRGAREHNLKNISLEIPKNKLVVVTGVSGSGKSSLAFDTLYAEGQRRYVESLSAYARQFLGVMDKPDVDTIEGLSPAISIDQKTTSHNPRSTVGTVTEIYDYLRLLFARIGHPHCPNCGIEITKLTLDEIVNKIMGSIEKKLAVDKIKPHSFSILSPIVRQKKGEFKDLFENLLSKGYQEIRVDNVMMPLSRDIQLIKTNKHSIDVIIDTVSLTYKDFKNEVFRANLKSRLTTAIEQALNLSDGLVILSTDKVGRSQSESVEISPKKTDSNRLQPIVTDSKLHEHLFSERFSCPNCGLSLPEIEPRMFSFNSPLGACETCKGLGTVYKVDPDLILNKNLSVNEGGILPFNKMFFQDTWYIRLMRQVAREEDIDFDGPIGKLDKKSLKTLLYGTNKVYRVQGANRFGRSTAIYEKFDGVVNELERRFFDSDSTLEGFEVNKYIGEETCDACEGKRLKKQILSITIDKKNISEISDLAVDKLTDYYEKEISSKLNQYETEIAKNILKEIVVRLSFLKNVGLSYLTLSRAARTLSGGELQRIRLASQIGTGLTGVLYVLDEPSIGLHPKDVSALIATLKKLRELDNTLIIVEHDRETMENADHLIELGPKAGREGGHVTFTGNLPDMKKSTTSITGQYLSNKKEISFPKKKLVTSQGFLTLKGARQFNLKNLTVKIPLGNLIAVTGASGSGKSTLVVETLYPALKYFSGGSAGGKIGDFDNLDGFQYVDRVYLVDQSPIGRTPRSNPATYVGFFDDIRELFAITSDAKVKGFKKSRFSFNLKGGRCEKCQGGGVIKIEMQFLPDIYVTCDACSGMRYNRETLDVKYKSQNIFDVLKMTVDEAVEFFQNHPKIFLKLKVLKEVGLGYIELGQSAPTFSGGEAQRIKLANELSRRSTGKTIYVLDEPTTGLHFYDIEKLLKALYQLVEAGNTVVIIEHNLDVVKNCQYIVDLGPDGGEGGGHLLYQGELDGIVKTPKSHTGQYLKRVV